MENKDKIELRSEKIRSIIGNVPSRIIRCGTVIVTIIIMGFFFIAFYIPYPKNANVKVKITNIDKDNYCAMAYIPYHYITEIKIEMPIQIEFEGYSSKKYGYQKGIIYYIDNHVIKINCQNFFSAYIKISNTGDNSIIQENMNGNAFICISNKSVIKYILGE